VPGFSHIRENEPYRVYIILLTTTFLGFGVLPDPEENKVLEVVAEASGCKSLLYKASRASRDTSTSSSVAAKGS